MNTKSWIGLALIFGLFGTAAALERHYAESNPSSQVAAVGNAVPYGLTLEIAGLLKQRDYAKALPLLQARFEEIKNDKKAVEQVKYYTGICAQRLGDAQPISQPAAQADSNIDPTTGHPRVAHTPLAADEIRAMSIKELGNFDYDAEKGSPVPPDVVALNGGKVRLNGYVLPLSQAEYLTEFALVPSLFSCCFGQPPGVQHVITVHLPKGQGVEYTVYEVSVEGTLKVDIRRKDEYTESIFEMDARSVKVLGKKQ